MSNTTPWNPEFQVFVNEVKAKDKKVLGIVCAYIVEGENVSEGHMAHISIDVAGVMQMGSEQYAAAFAAAAQIVRQQMQPDEMKPCPKPS